MGFFDSLLKSGAKKFVSDVVDRAVDKAVDGVVGNKSQNSSNTRTNTGSAPARKDAAGNNGIPRGVEATCTRIENVVKFQFEGYELRKNVPASVMNAGNGAVPYTYGLYYNGTPRAFINVIDQRNDYRLKRFRLSKEACEKASVPHFNFFSHLPNEIDYIANRLRENM